MAKSTGIRELFGVDYLLGAKKGAAPLGYAPEATPADEPREAAPSGEVKVAAPPNQVMDLAEKGNLLTWMVRVLEHLSSDPSRTHTLYDLVDPSGQDLGWLLRASDVLEKLRLITVVE